MKFKTLIGLLCIALVSFSAHAFWTVGQYVHSDITRGALGASAFTIGSIFGTTYNFSTKAIETIDSMHKVQDEIDFRKFTVLDGPSSYQAADHFDSESFPQAIAVLQRRYKVLKAVLSEPTPDQTAAWKLFGQMAHAVQDFYAHSNWLRYNKGYVDFGKYLADGSAATLTFGQPTTAETCDKADASMLLANLIITSGYYKVDPLPSGKCQHGTISSSGFSCLGFTVNGINHDSSCAQSDYFLAAKASAMSETIALAQAMLTDLVNTGRRPGACAFLGISNSLSDCMSPCAAQANNYKGSNSLVVTAVGDFTDRNFSSAIPGMDEMDFGGFDIQQTYQLTNVFVHGAVKPAPRAAGIFPATYSADSSGDQDIVNFQYQIGSSGSSYSIGTPNQVSVQSVKTLCTDNPTKTEFDEFTGTVDIGIVNLLPGRVSTNDAVTGSFTNAALVCQQGASAIQSTVNNGGVFAIFRCQ